MIKQIKYANTTETILSCFTVLQELRPNLEQASFVRQIKRQQSQGYQLVYLNTDGAICSVAGYRIVEYLAWGKALYIDDLVTAERARGKGYGSQMLAWLIAQAKDLACQQVHLDSGYHRHAAHRVYLNHGFQLNSHHFALMLP